MKARCVAINYNSNTGAISFHFRKEGDYESDEYASISVPGKIGDYTIGEEYDLNLE